MDAIISYRDAIKTILTRYAQSPLFSGDNETEIEIIFDSERDRYLLTEVGWDNGYRIYGTLIHLDIRDGKIWVQHDGTEEGIAEELMQAGVPKNDIVLGFRPAEIRQHSEFAVA